MREWPREEKYRYSADPQELTERCRGISSSMRHRPLPRSTGYRPGQWPEGFACHEKTIRGYFLI
ncbi:MAG: hypothetical protein J6Y48_20200 [Clostridia bacterium]|nr:hypothetical protein [Clostridia bacterium]